MILLKPGWHLQEPVKSPMMMMMMMNRTLLILCLLHFGGTAFSQEKDFGMWFEVDAEHQLIKNLDLKLAGSLRTFENSSKIDESLVEGGLQYKFSKCISISASYRLTSKMENDSQYYYRHKLFFDADASYPVGNLKLSARFRLQRVSLTYIEEEEDLTAGYVGRIKLKAEYDIPSFPLTPYVYFEAFNPLFENSGLDIYRNRISAGTELKINNWSKVEAGYIFQRDYKSQFHDINIISLNYKIKF
jgi:hypothetical protein